VFFSKEKNEVNIEMEELSEKLRCCEEKLKFFMLSIRALLVFIKDFSLDLEEIDSYGFKKGIDELSEKVISEKKIKKAESFFEKQKKDIVSYIKQQKQYLRDRENEFKEIIELLTNAIATLNAENDSYSQEIYEQTEKIEQITLLDDIRKIKTALSNEVKRIRKTIQEKQSHDQGRIEALSKRVSSLNVELKKTMAESLKDGLTGVYNRKAFDMHIRDLLERSTVTRSTFSMLILDIDSFKKINDEYGHQIGDRVLMAMVYRCRDFIRSEDFFARYGGDEFVIILPNVSLRNATKKARHLSKAIASSQYSVSDIKEGLNLSFSVSIGVAAYKTGDTEKTAIMRADKALYVAKHSGKNRVASEKDVK